MSDVDLVIAPTVPGTAPLASDPVYRWSDGEEDAGYACVRSTLPANLIGVPALSVPTGLGGDGLPLGAQILGRPFQESLVLRAGLVIEQWRGSLARPGLVRTLR